jgi:hypothetical protein
MQNTPAVGQRSKAAVSCGLAQALAAPKHRGCCADGWNLGMRCTPRGPRVVAGWLSGWLRYLDLLDREWKHSRLPERA